MAELEIHIICADCKKDGSSCCCTFIHMIYWYMHHTYIRMYMLMRDERRKEERSKQGQTNNKAKQHSTPKAVTFLTKYEQPRVGLEPKIARRMVAVVAVHSCTYTGICT